MSEEIFTVCAPDGAEIGCVVDGDGPALLMVHGTGDTHHGWRRVQPLLRRHFKLYLMDRRGRGVSGDQQGYSLEREWDDVAAVIDAIPNANVFAHSFGGMCALEGALHLKKNTLRRLMVYEPSVNRMGPNAAREGAVEEMGRLIDKGDREAVVVTHLKQIIRATDETIAKQRANPANWASRLRMAHTMPRELLTLRGYKFEPEKFAKISVPAEILYGEKSSPHARENTQTIAAAMPHAKLVELPGQAHFGMLTAPELMAGIISAFFK